MEEYIKMIEFRSGVITHNNTIYFFNAKNLKEYIDYMIRNHYTPNRQHLLINAFQIGDRYMALIDKDMMKTPLVIEDIIHYSEEDLNNIFMYNLPYFTTLKEDI